MQPRGDPSLSRNYDALVVGSGPAGSSAALVLARGGARVCVLEKTRPPRYKTCGGAIVRRAADLLPAATHSACERELYRVQINFLDVGRHFAVEREDPILSMVMRDRFDHGLLTTALDHGAELLSPCTAIEPEDCGTHVQLHTERGTLSASFLIVADGANGRLATRRFAPPIERMPAIEYEVFTSTATFERFAASARFDFGVGVWGYAWVFPKRNHLSVGVLSMQRGPVNLHAILEHYMKQEGLAPIEHIERHGAVIPTRPRKEGCQKGRVLLVGDAAGLVNPITAEGITFAILSGQLAAAAVLEGQGDPGRVRACYEKALDTHILAELRVAGLLAGMMRRVQPASRWLIHRRGQVLSEALTEVIMGRTTYRQLFSRPATYLKLLRGDSRKTEHSRTHTG